MLDPSPCLVPPTSGVRPTPCREGLCPICASTLVPSTRLAAPILNLEGSNINIQIGPRFVDISVCSRICSVWICLFSGIEFCTIPSDLLSESHRRRREIPSHICRGLWEVTMRLANRAELQVYCIRKN